MAPHDINETSVFSYLSLNCDKISSRNRGVQTRLNRERDSDVEKRLVQVSLNQTFLPNPPSTGGEDFQIDPGRDPSDSANYRDGKLPSVASY